MIGAGLAGAAVCAALARRGWRLTLIDAASGAAQAASALPVGMLSPHVTRAPTASSRLCDIGVAATRAELARLLPSGAGWQDTEVHNLLDDPGQWPATLVRPGALVQAWLQEAAQTSVLETLWNASVDRLEAHTSATGQHQWVALDADGQVLAQAPHAVIAAAFGSRALLAPLAPQAHPQAWPLRPVKGQMTLAALSGPALAAHAVRQNGVFVPCFKDPGLAPAWPTRIWAMGSTYERDVNSTHTTAEAHARNGESLAQMNAVAAQGLQAAQAQGRLLGWAQVRCTSLDRLPLAGAVPDLARLGDPSHRALLHRGRLPLGQVPRLPGLFSLCALGSRGLTLALPLAQQLAAQMDGAPPTLEASLLRAVDPARFAWRQAKRTPTPV